MKTAMGKYALISVSDRTGLDKFAAGLVKLGFTLLTTSGTGRYLSEHGIPSDSIEEYTGQQEILGGRVKTLHPRIHAGILARRSESSDQEDLNRQDIHLIDVVVVNLYPFEDQLQKNPDASRERMIEFIDIGGPTMIRAAAKNERDVYAVIDPVDYNAVLQVLQGDEASASDLRGGLAAKVFSKLAHYNLEIAKFLSSDYSGVTWKKTQELRYGENPQQEAALFQDSGEETKSWRQLGGKELSYNNILDADAGYRLIRSLYSAQERFGTGQVVSLMKHLTPCGVAIGGSQVEALQRAKLSDPRSHFGGIIGFAGEVSGDAAKEVIKDFSEIVIAPEFSDDAMEILSKRKNLRLIQCDYTVPMAQEVRSTLFGYLKQAPDSVNCPITACEQVAGSSLDEKTRQDLELAWVLVTHTKSNAIVLVKEQMLIGGGAGQTSRIDAVEVALFKASAHDHVVQGAVAASDAFFPFPDSIERLANAGVKAIVAPGGSKKDPDVIAAAKSLDIALLFAPERHFRH